MAWTKLSSKVVGSKVNVKENGTLVPYIIVHKGNPDVTMYDASCDGVWLWREECTEEQSPWGNSAYVENNKTFEYLNGSWFSRFDESTASLIRQVKIPYRNNGNAVKYLEDGWPCKVFVLSKDELGSTYGVSFSDKSKEGNLLSYFSLADEDVKRKKNQYYYTRSRASGTTYVIVVSSLRGGVTTYESSTLNHMAPCFIMDGDVFTDGNGNFTTSDPPVISSTAGINGSSIGTKSQAFPISYSVSDQDGETLTVREYLTGQLKKTFTTTGGTFDFIWSNQAEDFLKLLNGQNSIKITVDDGINQTVEFTLKFSKAAFTSTVSHKTGFETEELAAVTAMRLIGSFPEDAHITIELTNNFKDSAPVWEDTGMLLLEGKNYAFKNKSAVNGNCYNFRVTLSRGPSGEGGYLSGIVGTFQGAE